MNAEKTEVIKTSQLRIPCNKCFALIQDREKYSIIVDPYAHHRVYSVYCEFCTDGKVKQ